jgi:hypothetical protein
MNLIFASIGLGILGLDIVGALLILMVLAQGAKKRSVVIFSLIVLFGTALFGVLLSLVLGEGINDLADILLKVPAEVWKTSQLVVALLLTAWIFLRVLKRNKITKAMKRRRLRQLRKSLSRGVMFVAVLFVISALLDPAFLALIAASGREGVFFDIVAAHLIWSFVGQIPLYVVTVAILFNKETLITDWFKRLWKHFGAKLISLFTLFLGVITTALVVDAALFFALI